MKLKLHCYKGKSHKHFSVCRSHSVLRSGRTRQINYMKGFILEKGAKQPFSIKYGKNIFHMCTDLFITLMHLGSFIPPLKNQLAYCCIISIFIALLVSKWSYKYLLKTFLNVDMFDSNKSVPKKFLLLFATLKKQTLSSSGKSPYFPYNDQHTCKPVWPFF